MWIAFFSTVSASTLLHCYWLTPYDDLTGDGSGGPSREGGPDSNPPGKGDSGTDSSPDAITYPPGQGWQLIFHDEFDGTTLAPGWTTSYPRPGDRAHSDEGEAQWYLQDNVEVSGGTLKLRAKREEHQGQNRLFSFTSGMVQSKSIFKFQSGWVEAKMKLPSASGFHPAFWTWPSSENATPEVDIISGGDSASCRINTGTEDSKQIPGSWNGAWHVFAVDIEQDSTVWYFNGNEVHRSRGTGGAELYLLMTLAIPSPGPSGNLASPVFEVEYVRAFSRWRGPR